LLTGSKTRGPAEKVLIRTASTIQEYKDCDIVQLEAWGMEERELVPVHLLRSLSENGGIVLNAYNKAGRPVGTNISFLGKQYGKLMLYSHMTGVIPEYQSKGVGLMLKMKQREYAIEQGYDLICWTYDPMQSLNNWFNLNKLAAISRNYYINYYGEMPDKLNRGLDSDRFLAEWWIQSPRVRLRMENHEDRPHATGGIRIINETGLKQGVRQPKGRLDLSATDQSLLVEIPYSYSEIRAVHPSILHAWRLETRKTYSHYFNSGYLATGALVETGDHNRAFVKMERGPLERVLQT
jgi:predicted GNAT superfamily acetyltransferase